MIFPLIAKHVDTKTGYIDKGTENEICTLTLSLLIIYFLTKVLCNATDDWMVYLRREYKGSKREL